MSRFLLVVFAMMLAGITAGCVQSDNKGNPVPQEVENQVAPQEPKISKVPMIAQKPVSDEEIYRMFLCPCNCGENIGSDCCALSIERKNYANGLIDSGLSKEEVIIKMVQKYGINSLIDESDKENVKEELIKIAPKNRPRIVISPRVVDLGNVSFTEGGVSTLLSVQNIGIDDLVITGMDSSCGCTSAALLVDGVEGPKFSMAMHGTNPVGWSQALTQGQEAHLKIYYNTTFHPEFRGAATRIITVFSNDPIDFATEVKIKLNQVD